MAAVVFFLSLLAHEGSHAVVARHQGVGVRSITLWLFGGVAQLEGEAHTPGADFAIAAVGPGTSLALAGFFGALQWLLEQAGVHGVPVYVATWLWQINVLLAAFNLIPAAPLDGGRILRAALWRMSGNQTRAAVRAARVGVVFGVLLIGLGVVEVLAQSALGLWAVFLGWFLLMAARSEEATAKELGSVQGLEVGDVMDPNPPVLSSTMTIAELLAGRWWHGGTSAAVVDSGGFLAGVTTLVRLQAVPEHRWTTTRVADIAAPLPTVPVGRPHEPMPELLGRMYGAEGCPAIVLDPENRLAGMVSIEDVERAGKQRTHGSRQDLSGSVR